MRPIALALTLAAMTSAAAAQTPDPLAWTEEVEGARALAQVRAWNATTAGVLESAPGFARYRERATAILNDPRQIAYPTIHKDQVGNFWQDANNTRGLWRTASLASYVAGSPQWRTLIDLDQLARAEGKNWVWKGAFFLEPDYRLALVALSDGGKDAVTIREFDTVAGRFVEGGFVVPEAKTDVAWLDRDTLMVTSDFGPGTLTTSGYGRQVRRWQRGTALSAAPVVVEAAATDMAAFPTIEIARERTFAATLRLPTFWTYDLVHTAPDGRRVRSPLPDTASPEAIIGGRQIAKLNADWSVGGTTLKSGALVAYDIAAVEAGRDPGVELVMAPPARGAIDGVDAGETVLYVATLEDVAGRLHALTRGASGWTARPIPVPANSALNVIDAGGGTDYAFVNVEGLTQPDTLMAIAPGAAPRPVANLPAFFDASKFEVSQRFTASKDGTRIPYFLVRPKGTTGPLPTLLYAYGGFRSPSLPTYASPLRQFWLEEGNAYVLANIRGGGEYGPAWHEAGLKANRQRIYDDFHAVAETLKRERIASKLAAYGGSNGGLLVGVALTQRPELYDAILMGVPLADMRRYHTLLAGASWVGEYGDPDKPEEWAFIRKYSPLHNLRPGVDYPRPLIFTSTKDDRVHPAHARKMAARLDELKRPFYYYENIDGGHAGTANKLEEAYRVALLMAYLNREIGSGSTTVAAR